MRRLMGLCALPGRIARRFALACKYWTRLQYSWRLAWIKAGKAC